MRLLIVSIFCLPFLQLPAQDLVGKLLDGAGLPVVGAYIFADQGELHTHSDGSGRFELKGVVEGDTVYISSLGYEPLAYAVAAKTSLSVIDFTLREAPYNLEQIVVGEQNVVHKLSKIDLGLNPVGSSQEILRKVPGLVIGQHAGGGKAEQIFFRGFDIDHGTDLAISVDGMPVNMVSHAHGQGYADLHFLIPEVIERIDFGKGPHEADRGNFATAGHIDFRTKNKLGGSSVNMELGKFNTRRLFAGWDLFGQDDPRQGFVALEYLTGDGPFVSSQAFNRTNIMGKYAVKLSQDDQLKLQASYFSSSWDASGQIPVRAIKSGMIGRFGAIDDTEGGFTGRTNLQLMHQRRISANSYLRNRLYFSKYHFELFSNFTFFLEDPTNGDQIKQRENRDLLGYESILSDSRWIGSTLVNTEVGVGFRNDRVVDNELSHTKNRRDVLDRLSWGDVNEGNYYFFLKTRFDFGQLSVHPGLRLDHMTFGYVNHLAATYSTFQQAETMLSPKLTVAYSPGRRWQYFIRAGKGFHSNDTRVVVTGDRTLLPAAYGFDIGMIWKPLPNVFINAEGWSLLSEQEFVYVGDAGIVEPSGRSMRRGIDLGIRWQIEDWLFIDTDVNYAYSRSLTEEKGKNFIPLAPTWTSSGGVAVKLPPGLSGSLRYRYISDRPANEDKSIIADGYLVVDANVSYDRPQWSVGLRMENVFNVAWNETQFATESRLFHEPAPIGEIHFTPGTPFFPRLKFGYKI